MNTLSSAKSPYLLQHANNPIFWHEWSDDIFSLAKAENKPIFLSIGYSTCHWCHVMAHESFEDQEIADLINKSFISIKVDREERPDIDKIYMDVCQAITGQGGWPLSIFISPNQEPFFAATYIPKDDKYQRLGLRTLIPAIADAWQNKQSEIKKSIVEIVNFLEQKKDLKALLKDSILTNAVAQLKQNFDSEFGGFGSQPKFPSPHNFLFLLKMYRKNKDSSILHIVQFTLVQMRLGGIYDQLGGGFHRYSTDKHWLVPHFEKMLYDQAMMMMAISELFDITKQAWLKELLEDITSYLDRDLFDKSGAYYCAEDADSEGEEGKFYIFKLSELNNIYTSDKILQIKELYNFTNEGNYIDEVSHQKTSNNILHLSKIEDIFKAKELNDPLFLYRNKRVRPHLDDKILTDWNALLIIAFIKAYFATADDRYLIKARAIEGFISKNMFKVGRLLKRFRKGESGLEAHLDDYAYMLKAYLELAQCDYLEMYLDKIKTLLLILENEFWNSEIGAYNFCSNATNQLINNPLEFYDGALPSGNSFMVLNLLICSRIFNNINYADKAQKILEANGQALNRHPAQFSFALLGLIDMTDFFYHIKISGLKMESRLSKINHLNLKYPNSYFIFIKAELLKIEICTDKECLLTNDNFDGL